MRTTSIALLLFMIGCSSAEEPKPSPTIDEPAKPTPSEPPAVLGDLEMFGAACHAITNTAPLVAEEEVVGTRSPFEGGTIAPGLYHRVRTIRYVSVKGETKPETSTREKQTLRISDDGSAEVVHADEGAADDPTSFVITTSGNELRFEETCPEVHEPQVIRFTATANELSIARGNDGLIVFRRQE